MLFRSGIGQEIDECQILEAIRINDREAIARLLRRIADNQIRPIAPDTLRKLASYFDPAIDKQSYRKGPKSKKSGLFCMVRT